MSDEAYKAEIEAEYRQYRAEEVIHNREMHQRIMTAWEMESPRMWSNLIALGLTDKLAFVVQERMWRRREELLSQGFPVTDAREVAEQEELLMEPEVPEPDNSDLPPVLQDAPPHLKERWREQMARLNEPEDEDETPTH